MSSLSILSSSCYSLQKPRRIEVHFAYRYAAKRSSVAQHGVSPPVVSCVATPKLIWMRFQHHHQSLVAMS